MTYFHIGSLTIPSTWLGAIIALLAAALFYRLVSGIKAGDWYWNGFFLYFIVWKLSYILLNPSLFLDMPLSVIYFNGGAPGHAMALAAVSVYVFIKRRITKGEPLFLLPLFFICYEVTVNALEKNYFELLLHFLLLALFLILLWKFGKKLGNYAGQTIIILLLSELLILSIFDSLLSLETLTLIWVGIISLLNTDSVSK